MKTQTVFRFNIYYFDDIDDIQVRYVLADTEEEAEKKLEDYCKEQSKEGYAMPHIISGAPVELDNVIV